MARLALGFAAIVACAAPLGCLHASGAATALGAGQAELAALPSELTLLSWNTHKRATARFAAELRELSEGAQLVLLQEVTYPDPAWAALGQDRGSRPEPRAWTLVVAFERAAPGRPCWRAAGVATGSAATPVAEQALRSPIPEPLTRTPKSALLTWVPVVEREDPVLLVNLHGINFRRAAALDAQLHALDPILTAHAGPVIVAGDFNTWSRRRRQVVADFVARHELRSAFAAYEGEIPRLDHIYVRGWIVGRASVEPSRSSDHEALRVELVLPALGP